MSAPATYPDWDTNATNTSALVSGHVTDGFASDEIPTSRELNEWMMLVGLWIRAMAPATQPEVHLAFDFRDPAMGSGSGAPSGTYLWQGDYTVPGPSSGVMYWDAAINPAGWMSTMRYARVGYHVETVDFYVRSVTAGKTAKVVFAKQRLDGTGDMVAIASTTHSCTGGAGAWEVVTLSPAYDVEPGYVYWLSVLAEDTVHLLQAVVTPG